MARYEEDRILVRRSCLMPDQLADAEGYNAYLDRRKKYDLEDALRDGTASTVEKIKAAWEQFGDPAAFDRGYIQRVMAPQVLSALRYRFDPEEACKPVEYETFDFEREVSRNKDFTVTRIHCGGLTVYEAVAQH